MREVTGVFPNEISGVMVTPAMYVNEQVNRSSPPILTAFSPLKVAMLVESKRVIQLGNPFSNKIISHLALLVTEE